MTTDLTPEPPRLPVRLAVDDDLERNRLTVFFRLLLAIPHFFWLAIWGFFAVAGAIANWFIVLVSGRTHPGLHRFLAAYVNYATHVYAYLSIAANPYPGFVGDPGYPVDVELDPPGQRDRLTAGFRIVLAVPALLLAATMIGFPSGGGRFKKGGGGFNAPGAVLSGTAIVAWFHALWRGRAPEGVARLQWYALHYAAQTWAYVFLLTDRYPTSDPLVIGVPRTAPPHPIALREEEDSLERTRLTVFFRLPLLIPHLVWLLLWGVLVTVLAIVNWVVTLIAGQSPEALHNFFSAYLRYTTHVYAFVTLVANPFPGFAGAAGSYPVDVAVAPRERQNRWTVGFRLLLAIPAAIIQSGLNFAVYSVAILGWFASLFTGRMPRGLRNLGAFALRYEAQTGAYAFLLLTDRYPYAGPPAGSVPAAPESALDVPTAPASPPDGPASPPDPPAPDDPRLGWKDPPFVERPEGDD